MRDNNMMYANRALFLILAASLLANVLGFGINWGTNQWRQLPPKIIVKLLNDNGFDKVKLFEPDRDILKALSNTGIEVIVGIPNDKLDSFAENPREAVVWVTDNVLPFVSGGKWNVNIRYVAVGNEPFLKAHAGEFIDTTVPALKIVQAALNNAGLGHKIKATVSINADVYLSDDEKGRPSAGHFRDDIQDTMLSLAKFLNDSSSPIIINLYPPFLMVNYDKSFPYEFAFFDGKFEPVIDGPYSYTNALVANYDTLIVALEKIGFRNITVIIGEVGWPTDSAPNANKIIARRFNQGLINWFLQGKGSPRRPTQSDVYISSLIDEDKKDVSNGRYYDRHWGLFYINGSSKYKLDMGNGNHLVPAKDVKYLKDRWCVLKSKVSLSNRKTEGSVQFACQQADCSSLYNSGSCSKLDERSKVSYALNVYYQNMQQRDFSCDFDNLATVVKTDPSQNGCHFAIMFDYKATWGMWLIDAAIVIGIVVGVILIILVGTCLICGRKPKRRRRHRTSTSSGTEVRSKEKPISLGKEVRSEGEPISLVREKGSTSLGRKKRSISLSREVTSEKETISLGPDEESISLGREVRAEGKLVFLSREEISISLTREGSSKGNSIPLVKGGRSFSFGT